MCRVEVSILGVDDPVAFAFSDTAWAFAKLLAEVQPVVRVVGSTPVRGVAS